MFSIKSTNTIDDEAELVAAIEKVRIEGILGNEKLMPGEEGNGVTVYNKLQSDSSESGLRLTREKGKTMVKRLNKKDKKQRLLNEILKAAKSIERLALKLEELMIDSSGSEDESTSDSITESGCLSDKGKPTIEQATEEKQKEPKMMIENEGNKVDASVAKETIERGY